ncbi:MAG TPA: PP2C family serine/threonine-protein phosphatase [Trueperaceae bacterium]
MAATITGSSHLARDAGNEDALHCSSADDGTLLLALADGAGSASQAAEGARLAVDEAVASLMRRQPLGDDENELEVALRGALDDVRKAVASRLRRSRPQARHRASDFASTLLLAVVGGGRLAALQLGDGAVVVGSEGRWQRLTKPYRGVHAGETIFATSRGAARRAEVGIVSLERTEAIALLSDGLEPVATDLASGEPHAPFFEPLASFARRDLPSELLSAELADFLASDRVRQRSSDDLSLVLAVRDGP